MLSASTFRRERFVSSERVCACFFFQLQTFYFCFLRCLDERTSRLSHNPDRVSNSPIMNKTVGLDTSDECSGCADEPEVLDDSSVYMYGIMDDYSYDDNSYDDSYYDLTDTIDDGYEGSSLPQANDTIEITDSHIEGSVLIDETDTRNDGEIAGQPSASVDFLEENNNDPNNNMDSLQMSLEAPPAAAAVTLRDEPRVPSPMPGCSKDSVLLPDESPIAEMLIEQTRHVLGLVSRIHRDSVFEARLRDQVTPVSELRLWDLIPEVDRLEFPDNILPHKKPNTLHKIGTKSVAQLATNATNQTSTIKRGPDEDLCNIGCKRSSSTPDISRSVPMVNSGAIPKVPSSSQIATVPKIITEPGKIRPVPLEQLKTKPARVKLTEPTRAVSTPKVVKAQVAVGHGAIPKTRTWAAHRVNQTRGQTFPLNSSKPCDMVGQHAAWNVKFATPVATVSVYQPQTSQGAGGNLINDKGGSAKPASREAQRVRRGKPRPGGQEHREELEPTRQPARAPLPAHLPQYKPNVLPAPDYAPHDQALWAFTRQPGYVSNEVAGINRDAAGPLPMKWHDCVCGRVPHTQAQQNFQAQPAVQQQRQLAAHQHIRATVRQPLQAHQKTAVQQQIGLVAQQRIPSAAQQQIQPAAGQQIRLAAQQQIQPAAGQQIRLAAQQQIPTAAQQQIQPAEQEQSQPAKKVVCMEIYYKLINVFPNVDRAYVKKLCPADWAPGDRDAQLATLVEMILEGGDAVPKIVANDYADQEETNARTSSPDDIYENLLGIFPDADPHFLRDFAEKNAAGPDGLKQFVERNLEQRDYPTREQYMDRLKITEQQRQYTHGFDVKQYLSIIPDPAKYFTDAKRRCKNSTVAFEFLKSHFNKMRVNTISRAYTLHRYNITLTTEYLERNGSDLRSKRCGMEMPTEDILLLQEIAYIKHKTEITDYIANAKKKEENEFKMLKSQHLLLECQCCFDAECVPSKCCNCENGHIFCNECVVNGTNAKLGDGDTHINCFINCGSEFSLSVLQRVLAPTTFSILLKKRQAAEVMEAGVEGLVSCPFCHFASIPPEEDKIFKCLNPECTKESCRLCKELSHVPLKCDEVMKADKARLYIEEKMTAALARTCYKCQKSFFKEEGCNKITCVCGAIMCYLCDQPIKDYSHFRGQGSDDQSRCPLYSDTIRLDAVAVRKVAEQAQLEVRKQNPNVKIDTRNLLPAIPRPQRGPHQDVLNADELPRRAQRVIDLPPM